MNRFSSVRISNSCLACVVLSLLLVGLPAHAQTVAADRVRLNAGPCTLDSVNDLPGALVQIRRVLKPDGLFLGHMFGAGSLALLKSILLEAEGDRAAPHIHPQIDLRSAADLLVRAGFKLPVADLDVTEVRYANWRSIVSDLRDAGIGNALAGPRRYLGKDIGARLDDAFAHRVDAQGRATEGFTHLYLSGWSPSADQPKPAKRGSGQVSLADFLSKDRSG